MSVADTIAPPAELPEMRWMLGELQDQALKLALPPLLLVGLVFLVYPLPVPYPVRAEEFGLAVWLGVLAVWAVSRLSGRVAGAMLSCGWVAMIWLLTSWVGVGSAAHLLAVASALCAMTVGAAAGVGLAVVCTGLVLAAPGSMLPLSVMPRLVVVTGLWSTLGLVILTLRPVVTALQWSWTSYEESRRLLEKARDYQVQFKGTLKDLANANTQLTRLNRLAHALRQEAEAARLAKEQFVANVSHELRTPLNMLADLEIILRNSQHLSELIDDVLDLSQIEARRVALTMERVDLAETVEAAVVAVRPLFESKGLYLRTDVPAQITVYGDRTRIREIVLNLLSNAGRFTEHGGVTVCARVHGAEIVVSVADTGPGIPEEKRGQLFRPFEQLDGSVRRRYGGTGLGLAISKSFVELHGGRMWLESDDSCGTTICFTLSTEPHATADEPVSRWLRPEWEFEQRSERSLAPPPVVNPKVVVLDPTESLQRLATRYLQGVEVVATRSEGEALQELARAPAQALLVNAASGPQALQRIGALAGLPAGVPAIICSVPGVSETAGTLGIADYMVKPVSRERLLASLDRLGIKSGKVLIVDDEPEALRLFWRMLAATGRDYTVLAASSGEEALGMLRRERPDVMLLDLVMPEMDGFRLLEARGHDPDLRDIPVVVTSARDPTGQPIISSGLAVTQGGGLASHELLTCIDAIRRSLGKSL